MGSHPPFPCHLDLGRRRALVLFVVFGLTVSWRKNLLTVATIVTLAGLGTAAGLLIATRDVVPFTLVFLAIAAAVEISSCLEHWLSERWLAALAADLAVRLATWLVTREHGLPEGYAAIPYGWLLGVQVALLGFIWPAPSCGRFSAASPSPGSRWPSARRPC